MGKNEPQTHRQHPVHFPLEVNWWTLAAEFLVQSPFRRLKSMRRQPDRDHSKEKVSHCGNDPADKLIGPRRAGDGRNQRCTTPARSASGQTGQL